MWFIQKKELIDNFLVTNTILYQRNVDLKRKTWIHRGGIAQYYIIPSNLNEFRIVCSFFNMNYIFYEIVGATSNLYFLNNYNPDIVISTVKLKEIEETPDMLICDCGTNVANLAKKMIYEGVKGFEGLIDLPGTVGSSVYNNSSCYECSITEMLIKIEFLQNDNKIDILYPEDLGFTLRSSSLKRKEKKGVILRVYLKKEYRISPQQLIAIAENNHRHRKTTQEGSVNNLGSCFNYLKRNGFIYIILRVISFLCKIIAILLSINKERQEQIKRYIYFSLLGYSSILPYISRKSINCFIWRDDNADVAFLKYKEWMKKVYKTEHLEIEIKNGEI
jgi:UDP-N-acetylmuramate dehydrogenase